MPRNLIKILSLLLCICLLWQQSAFAQVAAELNIAGHLTSLHSRLFPESFRPLHLRCLEYLPESNRFQFYLDKGDSPSPLREREGVRVLMDYFYIGLSLPNDTFWVNLRPDSPNNIIDERLAQTDIGRIMLEADLQLKKDTSLATSPQTPEGREYWNRLYKKAEELYGYDAVTIPTLTRPWIVPGEIIIRETQGTGGRGQGAERPGAPSAYIYKATLKVMLEEDYLEEVKGERSKVKGVDYNFKDERSKALNEYSTQLIRELIIPKLTRAVNSSKRYAPLRQVYYSLILAQWFKARRVIANPPKAGEAISRLIDSQDLTNLTSKAPWSKTTYFQAYKTSFSEGEYNINEPIYTPTGQVVRSYMSGGVAFGIAGSNSSPILDAIEADKIPANRALPKLVSSPLIAVTGSTSEDVAIAQMPEAEIDKNADSHILARQPIGTPDGYSQVTNTLRNNIGDLFNGLIANHLVNYAQHLIDFNFQQPSLLQSLSDNPAKFDALVAEYERIIVKVESAIQDLLGQEGSHTNYKEEFTLGAQALVKLKVFELLARGYSREEVVTQLMNEIWPSLREGERGSFLGIGTEVEVLRKYMDNTQGAYEKRLARIIWRDILKLRLGKDGLIEFALPPSRAGSSQWAMIDSMIALGLIPKGIFSLHISGELPLALQYQPLLKSIASYWELIKAILYTSDNRILRFKRDPLAIKGGSDNVDKVKGEKSPCAIYDKGGEMVRIEYRTGDVVVPVVTDSYREAIDFIQYSHNAMILAFVAAIDPTVIKHRFHQRLLEIFDEFVSGVDTWKKGLPEEYKAVANLCGADLFRYGISELKDIVPLRQNNPASVEALRGQVESFRNALISLCAQAEELAWQPVDTDAVANLTIVQRLKSSLPPKAPEEKISLSDVFIATPEFDYLRVLQEVPSFYAIARRYHDYTVPTDNSSFIGSRISSIISHSMPQTIERTLMLRPDIFLVLSLLEVASRVLWTKRGWVELLWRRLLARLNPSPERRAFNRARRRSERAYRSNEGLLAAIIEREAIGAAAQELGITYEDLEMKLRYEEFILRNRLDLPGDSSSNGEESETEDEAPSLSSPARHPAAQEGQTSSSAAAERREDSGSSFAEQQRREQGIENALKGFIEGIGGEKIFTVGDDRNPYWHQEKEWEDRGFKFYKEANDFVSNLPVIVRNPITHNDWFGMAILETLFNAYDAIVSVYDPATGPKDIPPNYQGTIKVFFAIRTVADKNQVLVITITDNGLGEEAASTHQKAEAPYVYFGRAGIGNATNQDKFSSLSHGGFSLKKTQYGQGFTGEKETTATFILPLSSLSLKKNSSSSAAGSREAKAELDVYKLSETIMQLIKNGIDREGFHAAIVLAIERALPWDDQKSYLDNKGPRYILREIMRDNAEDLQNHINDFALAVGEDNTAYIKDLIQLLTVRDIIEKTTQGAGIKDVIEKVFVGIEALIRHLAVPPLAQREPLDAVRYIDLSQDAVSKQSLEELAGLLSGSVDKLTALSDSEVIDEVKLEEATEAAQEIISRVQQEKNPNMLPVTRALAKLDEKRGFDIDLPNKMGSLVIWGALENSLTLFSNDVNEAMRVGLDNALKAKKVLDRIIKSDFMIPIIEKDGYDVLDLNRLRETIDKSSSAIEENRDAKGGIDMRALPIMTQRMPVSSAVLGAPRLGPGQPLPMAQLNKEWQEIEKVLRAGIVPSTERMRAYLESCCASSSLNQEIDKVLACLAGILRLQEERVCATEPALKEMLALLEADKPAQELRLALGAIMVPEQEPSGEW